jgi:hypothetical protein
VRASPASSGRDEPREHVYSHVVIVHWAVVVLFDFGLQRRGRADDDNDRTTTPFGLRECPDKLQIRRSRPRPDSSGLVCERATRHIMWLYIVITVRDAGGHDDN